MAVLGLIVALVATVVVAIVVFAFRLNPKMGFLAIAIVLICIAIELHQLIR